MFTMRNNLFNRICSIFLITSFLGSTVLSPVSHAQTVPGGVLSMVFTTPSVNALPLKQAFTPALIKGVNLSPDNPLQFDFIIDQGESDFTEDQFREESTRMIKYFLTALTIPQEQMWVNLSPYEQDRVIPDAFGQTEMGRDILALDYMLKQMSAALVSPESDLGESFWKRVHKKAKEKYGHMDVPMNTFNKIWIVPSHSSVYEHSRGAFVVDSHLKVMLEEDYVALEANQGRTSHGVGDVNVGVGSPRPSEDQTQIMREILIPEIEREVNEGKTFAQLRQIYNSIILASWYKQALKESLLGQLYVDKARIKGVDHNDEGVNQKIYDQYVDAFKNGVVNLIKEDYDAEEQRVIPKKYFSGGLALQTVAPGTSTPDDVSPAMLGAIREAATSPVLRTVRVGSEILGDSAEKIKQYIESITPSADDAMAVIDNDSLNLAIDLGYELNLMTGRGKAGSMEHVADIPAEVYLIRHAQNIKTGDGDSLTEEGLGQAESLSNKLTAMFEDRFSAGQKVVVVSSPRQRAQQTIQPFIDRVKAEFGVELELIVNPLADETDLQGVHLKNKEDRTPEENEAFTQMFAEHNLTARVPGGQSVLEQIQQNRKMLSALKQDHPDVPVLVVTHGMTIATAMADYGDAKAFDKEGQMAWTSVTPDLTEIVHLNGIVQDDAMVFSESGKVADIKDMIASLEEDIQLIIDAGGYDRGRLTELRLRLEGAREALVYQYGNEIQFIANRGGDRLRRRMPELRRSLKQARKALIDQYQEDIQRLEAEGGYDDRRLKELRRKLEQNRKDQDAAMAYGFDGWNVQRELRATGSDLQSVMKKFGYQSFSFAQMGRLSPELYLRSVLVDDGMIMDSKGVTVGIKSAIALQELGAKMFISADNMVIVFENELASVDSEDDAMAASEEFRTVSQFLQENRGDGFTVTALAQALDLEQYDVQKALDQLVDYHGVGYIQIDTSGEMRTYGIPSTDDAMVSPDAVRESLKVSGMTFASVVNQHKLIELPDNLNDLSRTFRNISSVKGVFERIKEARGVIFDKAGNELSVEQATALFEKGVKAFADQGRFLVVFAQPVDDAAMINGLDIQKALQAPDANPANVISRSLLERLTVNKMGRLTPDAFFSRHLSNDGAILDSRGKFVQGEDALALYERGADMFITLDDLFIVFSQTLAGAADDAMTHGGIDMNPALDQMTVERQGSGLIVPVITGPIKDMVIDGIVPVIINVAPVTNLPLLLGLNMSTDEDPTEAAKGLSPVKQPDVELISRLEE